MTASSCELSEDIVGLSVIDVCGWQWTIGCQKEAIGLLPVDCQRMTMENISQGSEV